MKKALSLLLCLMLVLGALAACGGDSGGSSQSTGGSSSAGNTGSSDAGDSVESNINWDEHETFSWWIISTANDYYSSYNDNPVVKFLEEKFNVTFEFEEPVSGTEFDALSLMFGTEQYTDAVGITMYPGSIPDLYKDGVIINFADYLDYMPNLKTLLENSPGFASARYNDAGQILTINSLAEEAGNPWVGLAYRHDILVEMTNDNVQFPSGEDEPTTIADWEYMLPLFVEYFQQQGKVEYAGMILPVQGFFPFGELMDSFGSYWHFYVDGEDMYYGATEDNYRQYLTKMNEWYEKGWIYQDFATRTQDMFFMPNSTLTYGNACGIWLARDAELGDAMSDRDNGIIYDLRPMRTPIADGYGPSDMLKRSTPPTDGSGMEFVITTACENIEKMCAIMDYFYSEEGGMLIQYGLTAEQIPETDTLYAENGLSDGTYWFEGDKFVFNPALDVAGGDVTLDNFNGYSFSGYLPNGYLNANVTEQAASAHAAWTFYDDQTARRAAPPLSATEEEQAIAAEYGSTFMDYVYEMTAKYIIGNEPLSDESWEAYKTRVMEDLGVEALLDINRAQYARYLARSE